MKSEVIYETLTACSVIWKKNYKGTIALIPWTGTGSLEKCGEKFNIHVDVHVLGTIQRVRVPVVGNGEHYITVSGVKGWYKISGYKLTSKSIRFHIDIQVQAVLWYKVISDWVVAPFSKEGSPQLSEIILEHVNDIEKITGLENLSDEIWTKQNPQ